MAQYDTLDVLPNRGGVRTSTSRVKRTEFTDGYRQKVIVGLHRVTKGNTFSYSGDITECTNIEKFLNDRVQTAFYFRFLPTDPLSLFETADDVTLTHDGGLRWTVTATFNKYIGF